MLDPAPRDPDDAPPARDSAWILVVDDDDDDREAVRSVLVEGGYRVEVDVHGGDALARLDDVSPPSLIVLDLRMPVMDGWAFMTKLKARAALAAIPVVVLSAAGEKALYSAPVSAGYLAKPLDRAQLLQTVSACLWRAQERHSSGG